MAWKRFYRLLPAVVMAVGLTLTVQFSSGLSAEIAARQNAEQEAAIARFGSVADGRADEIRRESERVEGLIQALLESPTADSELESLTDDLGAFTRGPLIRAVAVADYGSSQLALPEGALTATEIPGSVQGITVTNEGRWVDTVTYRVFSDTNPGRSVAVVLDVKSLIDSEIIEDGLIVEIEGFPGELDAHTPHPTDIRLEGDVYETASGALHTHRDVALFGQNSQVALSSDAAFLATASTNELALLIVSGALLTLTFTGLAFLLVRRIDRVFEKRDVAANARRSAIARFSASFTHAPMGVVEVDHRGEIVIVNPRFASKLGYLPEELAGHGFLDLIDGQDRMSAAEQIREIREEGTGALQSERRYRTMTGSAVWMRESVSAIEADDGTVHILIQVEDISVERRTRFELHRRALYDELTGLPNRAHLINQLRLAVDNAQEIGDEVAVMFVDLNKFKAVNDTYGHEAGDQILIEVAERLRRVCRTGDTVARLGGDEFVVVCTGILDREMARSAADRYSEALNAPTVIDGTEMDVSASIGLVIAGGDAEPDVLLRNADKAMYQAKAEEGSGIVEFDYTMQAATVDRLSQEVALRQAVQQGELELHYQPIVNGETAAIVGVEALVRWHHPRNGLTVPGEFLPLAADLGLVPEIDRWAIETGAAALVGWSAESEEAANWYLTVNTVSDHYLDHDFADWVADVLVQTGLEPRRLVLERAEHLVYEDDAVATSTIRKLRSRGVRMSLDQFGVGRTALADLAGLEVDSLKIGRSFIQNATSREQFVLEGLVAIADGLGVELVVEGIESQAELSLALNAGLRLAQGYHFSRPVDGATLAQSRDLAIL